MQELTVRTANRTHFLNIDEPVGRAIASSGVHDGVCHVFVPHTTAGITINENADPDVLRDMEAILERMAPWRGGYAHAEGNSAAHVKASLMGFQQTVLVRGGRPALGTWQSLYLCEFDGPRTRKLWVQTLPAP